MNLKEAASVSDPSLAETFPALHRVNPKAGPRRLHDFWEAGSFTFCAFMFG